MTDGKNTAVVLQTILFTTDEDILEKVAAHDQQFEVDMLAEAEEDEDMERPLTADGSGGANQVELNTSLLLVGMLPSVTDFLVGANMYPSHVLFFLRSQLRPFTSAAVRGGGVQEQQIQEATAQEFYTCKSKN